MNSISLLGADTLDESAKFILDEAVSTSRNLLSAIASQEDFTEKMAKLLCI